MDNPWANIEAYGRSTGKDFTRRYILVGRQQTYQKDNDTVDLEFVEIDENASVGVVVLSNEPWKPVWTKNANNHITGNTRETITMHEDLPDVYMNVLLLLNGSSSTVWLSEHELQRFTWQVPT